MRDFVQISVVIPTYNRAKIVPKAIESVLSQTHPAVEIIVVDDGSKDDTREVLAGYGERIRPISQANAGLAGARNTGIRAATGEWVAFLDDDDEYVRERLEIAAESIARNPGVDVHATNTALVNEDGTELDMFQLRGCVATEHMRLERPLEWVLRGCFFAQTMVARRQALQEVGLFRNTFYEDMDLFVRLAVRSPWTVDVRRSLRLQRLAEEELNLSSFWRSRPVENYEALTRIHRNALELPGLIEPERDLIVSGLATNLYELGRALVQQGEIVKGRKHFSEAAQLYPRFRSRMKARLAAVGGKAAIRLLDRFQRRRGVFRSAASPT